MEMFEEPALPILLYHQCPPNLERQFDVIRKSGYKTVHLAEVLSYFEKPSKIPPDYLVLTFDDALLDFFDIAVPLLKHFDFSATICVPTGRISSNSQDRSLDNWENNENSTNPVMTWDELKELKQLVKTDSAALIEFASHSASHVNLNNLADKEALRHEIFSSKTELQDRLGVQDPIFFCFPYGAGEGKFSNLL